MPRALGIGVALAVALAAISLALPYQPVYDPWGWLVWGRELVRLDLATADGLSWKPLPVLIDAPLSLLGDAAPKAWLLVARSGWLIAPLLAGWLAARLAGEEAGRWRAVAAVLASASVALTGDSFTPPARQFTGGLSEPLLVALVLGAVAAALARRPAAALWLGVAAALLRPECWPFLAIWALWAVREDPGLRPHALAAAVLVPLAWFVPDLVGAGDPLAGSRTARGGPLEPLDAFDVLGRALAAPLAAAWIGVALLVAGRCEFFPGYRAVKARSTDRVLTVLLVGAGAWIGLVATMAIAGFAGLPRFLAPASAAIAIVGGVGLARGGAAAFGRPPTGAAGGAAGRLRTGTVTVAAGRSRSWQAALIGVALGLAVAGFGLRAAKVPGDLRDVNHQASLVNGLFDLTDRVDTDRLLTCGHHVRLANLLTPPTALAWHLDEPLASVRTIAHPEYGVALSTRRLPGKLLARLGRWRATDLSC